MVYYFNSDIEFSSSDHVWGLLISIIILILNIPLSPAPAEHFSNRAIFQYLACQTVGINNVHEAVPLFFQNRESLVASRTSHIRGQ